MSKWKQIWVQKWEQVSDRESRHFLNGRLVRVVPPRKTIKWWYSMHLTRESCPEDQALVREGFSSYYLRIGEPFSVQIAEHFYEFIESSEHQSHWADEEQYLGPIRDRILVVQK